MRLGISRIAYGDASWLSLCVEKLDAHNVDFVEVTPYTTLLELKLAMHYGLKVASVQAVLGGCPTDWTIFSHQESIWESLDEMCRLARMCKAATVVYGSPNTRLLEGRSLGEAHRDAIDFFRVAACIAAEHRVMLCLEPNPPEYGCEVGNRVTTAAAIVRNVGSPWFRLILDTGCCELGKESFVEAVNSHADILAHVHVSCPHLTPLCDANQAEHEKYSAALQDKGYAGVVSLEMKAPPVIDTLYRSLAFFDEVYG